MGQLKPTCRHNGGLSDREEPGCDSCPYWSRNTQSCLVVKDGLFLPSSEHIITYCETPYFASCSYYQEHIQQALHRKSGGDAAKNRRKFKRHPFRQLFRFSENKENGAMGDVWDDRAQTIDMSEGGMRFETREEIPVDTQIDFTLDDEKSSVHGHGRVIWSRPIENSPLFHCGFVFTDSDSSRQAEKLLDLLGI